jgi:CheY-like chemotaxis protein
VQVPGKAPILLIEDDADMRALVGSLLEDEDSPVMVASSGRAGLARLQATTEHMVVVCSGALCDMTAAAMLAAAARDGGLVRRHAFVVVGPEQDALALARAWETRVPIFTVLEPYSRNELHLAVERATQCATLSRTLFGAPRSEHATALPHSHLRGEPSDLGRVRELRTMGNAGEEPAQHERATNGVMIVGGAPGIRRLMAGVLSRGPFAVTSVADEQVSLAWLRACPEPMVVILNATRLRLQQELVRSASKEARLVRHTYILMLPTGIYVSVKHQELLGLLNVPIMRTPFSPSGFRDAVRELATSGVSAGGHWRPFV